MQESTARTQGTGPHQAVEYPLDHLSHTSMDTISSFQSQSIDVVLEYDGRLRFHVENTHGAKIYRDFLQRYVVKVEDHPFDIDQAPWVNYQGDRYMGRDGGMYLLTENLGELDQLGNPIPRKEGLIKEAPLMRTATNYNYLGLKSPYR